MKNKIGVTFLIVIIFFFQSIQAKEYLSENNTFKIDFTVGDTTDRINDAFAEVKILVGNDVNVQWPIKSAGIKQYKLKQNSDDSGLTEGAPFEIILYTQDDTLRITSKVETSSMSELFNGFLTPAVNKLYTVLFWDPFAALNFYDPKITDDNGNVVYHANGTPKIQQIPFIVVWLIIGALVFTFYTRLINFRGVKYAVKLLKGDYDDHSSSGEVSHFQALTTALSATVGLGNIAGVAVAVSVGGAGATFWMIVAGILGMASKFVECTLGVKYRVIKNGEVSGGPMYYLSKGVGGPLGKVLAILFAVLCVGGSFGGGNMFQANQAFLQLSSAFPSLEGNGFLVGIILSIFVGIVIIGGIKSIARVTDKVVPLMCGIYVLAALIIIIVNINNTGEAISSIFYGAFSPDALKGGVIGVLITGFRRAAFSNEAGVGSASIAHSAVKTDAPASEGLVALLEPFIDTVVVCTMTALVLIFTGYADNAQGFSGAALTTAAFASEFSWFSWVLLVAIILFAFSTMISWSYYGLKAWEYLFGDNKRVGYLYKIIFLLFIVIGASSGSGAVIDFSDLMILGMALPNILGLYILLPEVKIELRTFIKKVKGGNPENKLG
ncbi:MAG: amino acid carrier protein [Flavobacteriales bacterium]|nr:amino acid carrier protein [Flavobacteriales bacterium]